MPDQTPSVLLVRSEKNLHELPEVMLHHRYAYRVETAVNAQAAWERVRQAQDPYDVVVIDEGPQSIAEARPALLDMDLVHSLRAYYPDTEVIICLNSSRARAVEAIQAGAFRYLVKPVPADELAGAIEHAVEYRRLKGTARPRQAADSCRQALQ